MYRITFFIFTIVMLLVLAGCPPSTATLKTRALEFVHKAYDSAAITQYMTPAFQESAKAIEKPSGDSRLATRSPASKLAALGKDVLSKVTDADITIQARGKWAQVTVGVTLPYGREDIPTTWLFVDGNWYLFVGGGGEEATYGKAPYFVD
jgi:hypothetical protein